MSESCDSGNPQNDDDAIVCFGDGGIPAGCHPRVQAITDYWQSIHPRDGLPGRQHFDPIQIPRLLANIRLVDVVGDPPRFRIRLTGTRLTEFFGADDTGRWMDEIHTEFAKSPAYRSYMRVLETGLANWRRGQCELGGAKNGIQYERVQLPFATDGVNVDMILICGVFGKYDDPLT